jgi:hypothetical protein
MTNVMHKFLIYLSIDCCITFFGPFLAHQQRPMYNYGPGSRPLGMVQRPGADTIPRKLETSTEVVHLPLQMAKKGPKHK